MNIPRSNTGREPDKKGQSWKNISVSSFSFSASSLAVRHWFFRSSFTVCFNIFDLKNMILPPAEIFDTAAENPFVSNRYEK